MIQSAEGHEGAGTGPRAAAEPGVSTVKQMSRAIASGGDGRAGPPTVLRRRARRPALGQQHELRSAFQQLKGLEGDAIRAVLHPPQQRAPARSTRTASQSVQPTILHLPRNFLNSETGPAGVEKAQAQRR